MRPNFAKAFVDERTVETEYGTTLFKTHQIGELIVQSGLIVACDPFVFFDSAPFTTQIPVGVYPVILSVAGFNDDQRVAYAKLHISNQPTVLWEMALLPDQDIKSLKEDEFFGYPVDAGTGCFMDSEAASVFLKKFEDEVSSDNYSFSDFVIAEMEKNYVHTWNWANIKTDETNGNLIAFTAGFGDGAYPSYFGFDIDGKVTSIVTDFQIIDDKEVYFTGD
jgi:hypothetical protein